MSELNYSVGDSVFLDMKNIFEKDVLGDISIICNDGKLKKNKLLVGLVFPYLKYCEVFDNNTEHVLIVPDESIEGIITIMAKKLGIHNKYSFEIGQITSKRKRGRPFGSLGKNKKVNTNENQNISLISNKEVEEKTDDNLGSYEYNPSKINFLKMRLETKDQNQISDTFKINKKVQPDHDEDKTKVVLNEENKEYSMIEKVYVIENDTIEEINFTNQEIVDDANTSNKSKMNIRMNCQHCEKSYGKRSHLNRHIQSAHSTITQ